jgi:prophage regulatory protein
VLEMTEVKMGAPRRMLDIDAVLKFVPLTRNTIFRLEKKGQFPKSKFITPNRRVWFEDEILAWQEGLDAKPSRRRILRRSPNEEQ